MAVLTAEAKSSPDSIIFPSSSPCTYKSEPSANSASPLNPPPLFKRLIFVRYLDHVLYNRTSALAMKPQTREAVGWLIYDCEHYVTLVWDRDAEPPTLHGGDPKASGMVLLKSDIIALERLKVEAKNSHENIEWVLNSPKATVRDEYALPPKKRKTQRKGETET
jgi:hypothetical protein